MSNNKSNKIDVSIIIYYRIMKDSWKLSAAEQ